MDSTKQRAPYCFASLNPVSCGERRWCLNVAFSHSAIINSLKENLAKSSISLLFQFRILCVITKVSREEQIMYRGGAKNGPTEWQKDCEYCDLSDSPTNWATWKTKVKCRGAECYVNCDENQPRDKIINFFLLHPTFPRAYFSQCSLARKRGLLRGKIKWYLVSFHEFFSIPFYISQGALECSFFSAKFRGKKKEYSSLFQRCPPKNFIEGKVSLSHSHPEHLSGCPRKEKKTYREC